MQNDTVAALLRSLVQSFAEAFPISSSAHLILVEALLQAARPFSVAAVLLSHLGSAFAMAGAVRNEVAVVVTEIRRVVKGVFGPSQGVSKQSPLLTPRLAVSLLGTAVLVLPLQQLADGIAADPRVVAATLLVNGAILFAGSRLSEGHRGVRDLTYRQVFAIGIAHSFGVIPGISRLGTSLVAGIALGLQWYQALVYSFLLGIASILGGAVVSAPEVGAEALRLGAWQHSLLACVLTALATAVFLRLVLTRSNKNLLIYSAAWCSVLGLMALCVLQVRQ